MLDVDLALVSGIPQRDRNPSQTHTLPQRNVEGQTTAITGSQVHCILGLTGGSMEVYDLVSGSLTVPRLIVGGTIIALMCVESA